MAQAGDGARRSEQRRLGAMISLRLDPREKRRFEDAARREGFPSLAAWILDRCRCENGPGPWQRRILVGQLGGIGAELSALTHLAGADRTDQVIAHLSGIAARIAGLQRDIMKGGNRAGEDDR